MTKTAKIALTTTLLFVSSTTLWAQDNSQPRTTKSIDAAPEMEMIAFDYFDANWKISAGTTTPKVATSDDLVRIATDYLDANWMLTEQSVSAGSKSATAVAVDYLDANWVLNEQL